MNRTVFSLLLSSFGVAAMAAPVDFVREVQPILTEHCNHCHGSDEGSRKGGLRLDVRDAALKGGKSDGPSIVPGKAEASAIMARITSHDPDEVMPPPKEKKPVSGAQADILKRWISEGAVYAKHWAFEEPKKTPVETGGSGNAIDAIIRSRLESLHLAPAPPAEPAILCRRLHLDITGLPPSPAEVAEFEKAVASAPQGSTDPIFQLIGKLQKSSAFGEKWARHWLDAARYSDSNGYEKDLPRDQWAWRDWVINAFNKDMPYDQFLIEQFAGDLLPEATQEKIVATGFLRNSMINEEGAVVPEQFRMDEMFDRMDCIGKAALGLSIQCAQCHSHKFDPLTQDEYYGIFAFFNNGYEAQSWVYAPDQLKEVARIKSAVTAAGERLKKEHPSWPEEMGRWEKDIMGQQIAWTPLTATELGSTSGLNHPTQQADLSVMTLGHPSTSGDIFIIAEPDLTGVTGLRLEALTHRDLPFNGPGRSKYGTWAISEMRVSCQVPGSGKWEPLKMVHATADHSEADAPNEEEWKAGSGKQEKRVRGPVSFLIDGKEETGWRADRGPGLRNQEDVAVVQFEKPLSLPKGTKLKVLMLFNHGGNDNGRHNLQLGCCRLSTTTVPNPQAAPVEYAAVLAMQTPADKRSAEQQQAVFTAWRKTVKAAQKINEAIAGEWGKYPAAQTSVLHLAERDGGDARPTMLLDRGVWDRPKQSVAPHTPVALHPMEERGKTDRLAFARWIADKRSPLTARVAVNRVWQAIFGVGLVETSEDFGTRAPVPEYRDVLDWLSVDFMEHGWSHKHLIETILSSATYRQSSHVTPALLERDPKNRYLARGPRFRMEAEVVRDSALSMAGLLHQAVGGPSIFPPVPQSVLDYNYTKPTYWTPPEGPERYRRALYVFRKRSMPDPVLSSFDAPNGDLACARRPRSNTPLSALTSLNETVFVEAAQAMAIRILREGGSDDAARAEYAYRLCTARGIRPAERQSLMKLLNESRARLRQGELKAGAIAFSKLTDPQSLPPDATPNDIAAWTILSRVLLNLDETMTKS